MPYVVHQLLDQFEDRRPSLVPVHDAHESDPFPPPFISLCTIERAVAAASSMVTNFADANYPIRWVVDLSSLPSSNVSITKYCYPTLLKKLDTSGRPWESIVGTTPLAHLALLRVNDIFAPDEVDGSPRGRRDRHPRLEACK